MFYLKSMKLARWLRLSSPKTVKRLDPRSLRMRLTFGIAAVLVLGIGSIAIWTSGRMQHILVSTHKQSIGHIATRFPQDVEIYSQMMSVEAALQKAVDNLTTGNTLLWVKDPKGKLVAQSEALKMGTSDRALVSLPDIPAIPMVHRVNDRYWVLCGSPLRVNEVLVGEIMLAQDITGEQIMFRRLIWSLCGASAIAIGVMTVAIALYVKRSLHPLRRMSKITARISPDTFNEERLHLDNAPTEVQQLARSFDEMLIRLHQAWENQRQFVSNVSHELRTPLTIVSGYLQSTLRRGTNLTEPQRDALGIASSEAERTVQLLEDLLDLARMDNGHLRFQLQSVLLNELVEEVVEMARKQSDRSIEAKIPPGAISAMVDVNRLKQVLLNLIDNAVKYSEAGKPVTVVLDERSDRAIIEVRDRGYGIPLAHQSRIFERFYRVDEARSRSTGGTGLGLSIVKTLVEGMGGTVTVRSQLGEGSTFFVSLSRR